MEEHLCTECGTVIRNYSEESTCPACLMKTKIESKLPWKSTFSLSVEGQVITTSDGVTNRYQIVREHARGGMGRVMLVHDPLLGRDIALKELIPSDTGEPGSGRTPTDKTHPMVARFLREARITGKLEHPSITPVHELGQNEDGSYYYTMKFVRGHTLDDAIAACETLEDRLKLLPHFTDMCNAIAYAHSKGVIHRDIKPQNVLIGEYGETVLVDWGLAKVKDKEDIYAKQMQESIDLLWDSVTEQDALKTQAGSALGTPAYMPPEQVRGDLIHIDELSDIYSLGVVLYQILTGKLPFYADTAQEMLDKVQHTVPPTPQSHDPRIPADLDKACRKAISKRYGERFSNAKELGDIVENSKLRIPKSPFRKYTELIIIVLLVSIHACIFIANWYTGNMLEKIKTRLESENISIAGNIYHTTLADHNTGPGLDPLGAIYSLPMQFPRFWDRMGSYNELSRALQFYQRRWPDINSLSDHEVDALRSTIALYEDVLPEIHRIAAMPRTRISEKMMLLMGDSFFSQLASTEIDAVRACVNLLIYEATILHYDKNYEAALNSCIDAIYFSAHLQEFPTMINTDLRFTETLRTVLLAQLLLIHTEYTPEQWGKFVSVLEIISAKGSMEKVWQGEINHIIDKFALIRKYSNAVYFENFFGFSPPEWINAGWLIQFWVNLDEAYSLEILEGALLIARHPFYNDQIGLTLAEDDANINQNLNEDSGKYSISFFESRVTLERLETVIRNYAELNVYVSLVHISKLLKQVHSETGQYPGSLEELKLLDDTLSIKDPFSGDNFLYQSDDKGFTLTSAGQDKRYSTGTQRRENPFSSGDLIIHASNHYKTIYEKYPESIDEMVPYYFNKVPLSYINGKHFQIRTAEKSVNVFTEEKSVINLYLESDDLIWVSR